MRRPSHLSDYVRKAGALTLTVEPYWRDEWTDVPRTWSASVHQAVGEDYGPISVACKIYTGMNSQRARTRAINRGHAMLITALIQGFGFERCAECGRRALDSRTNTLGGAPICETCLIDYLAENGRT